jgi:hypothetical protein
MAIDSSQPIAHGPRPEWTLPGIGAIEMRRIAFQARRPRNFASALARYDEAIEFIVHTTGPIPARAMGPALFIAGKQISESEQLSDNTYRFLAFDMDRLESGASISWGWMGDPEDQRRETGYRFDL